MRRSEQFALVLAQPLALLAAEAQRKIFREPVARRPACGRREDRSEAGPSGWLRGFLIAQVYTPYTWFLWPVLLRSAVRQLGSSREWSKTEREPLAGPSQLAVVEPEDPEALATALVSLLLAPDEARQLGEAGRACAARFPHAALVDRIEEVYREAHQPAAAPAHGRASSLPARPRPASAAAAEAGDAGAQNNLGLLAAVPDPPERAEARTWRTQEAEAGPADAPELPEQFEDD